MMCHIVERAYVLGWVVQGPAAVLDASCGFFMSELLNTRAGGLGIQPVQNDVWLLCAALNVA